MEQEMGRAGGLAAGLGSVVGQGHERKNQDKTL